METNWRQNGDKMETKWRQNERCLIYFFNYFIPAGTLLQFTIFIKVTVHQSQELANNFRISGSLL